MNPINDVGKMKKIIDQTHIKIYEILFIIKLGGWRSKITEEN